MDKNFKLESQFSSIAAIGFVSKDGGYPTIEFFQNKEVKINDNGSYNARGHHGNIYIVKHQDLAKRISELKNQNISPDLSGNALKICDDIKSLWEQKKHTLDRDTKKLIQNDIDQLITSTYMP